MATVLIADDEVDFIELYQRQVEKDGHEVISAQTAAGVRKTIEGKSVDVVLLDLYFVEESGDGASAQTGLALLKYLNDRYCDIPVIMFSNFANESYARQALQMGAYDFIEKAGHFYELLRHKIRIAAGLRGKELDEICLQIGMFPGQSPVFREYLDKLKRFSRSNAPVLICGESGSGKELASLYIHKAGSRRTKPWEPRDLCAGNENLVEDLLFGHKRGSYSNAIEDRQGIFEWVDGGTVFLDEIENLPLTVQAKLLRVLREGEVIRQGEEERRRVDFRLISATNKSLEELVEAGEFRKDLYLRLHQLSVTVPPLRKCREDVFPLVMEMVERRNHGRSPFTNEKPLKWMDRRVIVPECKTMLEDHSWSGNISEVITLVTNLFVLNDERSITPDTLSRYLKELSKSIQTGSSSGRIRFYHNDGRFKTLDEVSDELQYSDSFAEFLREVRAKCGSWELAAKVIKTSEDTLERRRKKLREFGFEV